MKTVGEMFVSLTTMLINPFWAPIIGICVENWQCLKKVENHMSRHDKRYRSEAISPPVLCADSAKYGLCNMKGDVRVGELCYCR